MVQPSQPKKWSWIRPNAYFRGLWNWFREGSTGWLIIFLAIAIAAALWTTLTYCLFPPEQTIRLFGGLLQLLGFGLTIIGLNSTLLNLGLKSIPSKVVSYIRRAPLMPIRRVIHAQFNLKPASFTITGHGATITLVGSSIEERVEHLENEIKSAQSGIKQLKKDLERAISQGKKELEENQRDLKKEIGSLEKRITNLFDSNVTTELVGVLLFLAGVTLATASPELSSLAATSNCE